MSPELDAAYGRFVSSAPRRIRLVLLAIASAALLGALLVGPAIGASDTGAAVARKKSQKGVITGSLSKRGYTLLALSASSPNASSVHVTRNRFRLRAPSGMRIKPRALRGCVTLHLRAPNGTYAGPVVFGTKRKGLAIVGVNTTTGASLGAIAIDRAKGYARTKRKPAARLLCSKLVARATRKGVPIGNGRNVGLVRSTKTGSGQDSDLDGVPNSLDSDDNGNLILDKFDRSATRSATRAQASQAQPPNAFMGLTTTFSGAVDVNAYGSSDQDVREAERTRLSLAIMGGGFDPGTPVELDCGGHPDLNNPNAWIGGLSYCTRGGTGRLLQGPGNTPGFPTPCCDADGDGLAELRQIGPMANPVSGFFGMPISPGATPEQIHPGDVLIMKGTRNGAPVDLSSTLGLVLSTPPALARYDDRQGDSGTLSYPFVETTSRAFPEIPVRANASGDVVVDLTFWRAQRLRIATEPGSESWMDVGHMSHVALTEDAGPLPPGVFSPLPNGGCPASSYSNVDAKLSLQPPNQQLITPYLKDLEGDRPTDRAKPFDNSFSYTLNLTNCLASYGVSFNIGESRHVSFWGVSEPTGATGGAQTFATASSLVIVRRVG